MKDQLSLETNENEQWGFIDSEFTVVSFLNSEISKYFGEETIQKGSADWGGMPVWCIDGDNCDGVFIVINDDNEVDLIRRTVKLDDEIINEFIMSATNKDELDELLDEAVNESVCEALDLITEEVFNSLGYGEEIKLTKNFVLYRFSQDHCVFDEDEVDDSDVYVIILKTIWKEVLQVQTNGVDKDGKMQFVFEQL